MSGWLATWPPGCDRGSADLSVGQGQRGTAVLTAGAASARAVEQLELELDRLGPGRLELEC
jgi:hypothetical protein